MTSNLLIAVLETKQPLGTEREFRIVAIDTKKAGPMPPKFEAQNEWIKNNFESSQVIQDKTKLLDEVVRLNRAYAPSLGQKWLDYSDQLFSSFG